STSTRTVRWRRRTCCWPRPWRRNCNAAPAGRRCPPWSCDAMIVWLFMVFLVGIIIGSFLNVCIERLPLEKSLLWPGSRCGHCLQPVKWYDNVPLLSYWILQGRCRQCGGRFSIRYFAVELITGIGFVLLFWWVVGENVHEYDLLRGEANLDIWAGL